MTYPGMIEKFLNTMSSILVSIEACFDKFFCVFTNFFEFFLCEHNFFLNNIFINFFDISSVKWSDTTQKLVSDNP